MKHTGSIASALIAVIILAGCATSDYGRITDKIAAYEGQAVTARDNLKTANSQSKITLYRTLISLNNKQLEIARRINPESNPAFKSGSITLEQSKKDKAERIAKLEKQLEQTMKERDGLVLVIETPAPAPAPAPAPK
ncbi:MAG: hypothetical protein WCO75_02515 [Planctomycetota bacterium]|nr:MAG: hypothetical protein DWH86_03495 [Planctomycetota bacterium]